MTALVGRTWAASPPDVVTTIVTSVTHSTATVGAGAMSAGAMATAKGPWGTVLSEIEKNALNSDAKKDLEEQGAPGIDALGITS
eukprot:6426094-Prymnesium_polylepis.1